MVAFVDLSARLRGLAEIMPTTCNYEYLYILVYSIEMVPVARGDIYIYIYINVCVHGTQQCCMHVGHGNIAGPRPSQVIKPYTRICAT